MEAKSFKQIPHKENISECILDSNHSNQKNFRDSQACWITVPAFAKIQAKYGVTSETVNAQNIVQFLASKCDINLSLEDLNRSRTVLEVAQVTPETATTDTALAQALKPVFDIYVKRINTALDSGKLKAETLDRDIDSVSKAENIHENVTKALKVHFKKNIKPLAF